jgi:hypothetical protein
MLTQIEYSPSPDFGGMAGNALEDEGGIIRGQEDKVHCLKKYFFIPKVKWEKRKICVGGFTDVKSVLYECIQEIRAIGSERMYGELI